MSLITHAAEIPLKKRKKKKETTRFQRGQSNRGIISRRVVGGETLALTSSDDALRSRTAMIFFGD